MPEQDAHAAELQHGHEVLHVMLPSSDQSSAVVQPGEEPLDDPATLVAAQGAAILRPGTDAIVLVGRDEIEAKGLQEVFIERIAVIRLVADQPRRDVREEARVERRFDEADFRGRSAGHVDGDRKTAAVDDCHDFVAFPTFRRPDGGAPFFAAVKLARMKGSPFSFRDLPTSSRSRRL